MTPCQFLFAASAISAFAVVVLGCVLVATAQPAVVGRLAWPLAAFLVAATGAAVGEVR